VRIGYVLPNSLGLADPHDMVELAVVAERLGASSLWVSHHVVHAGYVRGRIGEGNYYDAIVSLTAAALATSTARIGTSVLVLGYLNPVVLAKQLATIDWLSGGRLDAGVGVGSLPDEYAAVQQVAFERRGRYADECIDVMRTLWSGGSGFKGDFFTLEGVDAYPRPLQTGGIPILVGGVTEAALRRLAARGDGWHGIGLEPDAAADAGTRVVEALAAVGRDTDAVPFQLRLHVPADDLDVAGWVARADAYERAGVTDLVLAPQSPSKDEHLRWLETLLPELTPR
jgi:probable F420-dependent oxidoreductase